MSMGLASKRMQIGYINLNFTGMFIGIAVFGAAMGVGLAVLLPWLWSWIKPIIHGWTV